MSESNAKFQRDLLYSEWFCRLIGVDLGLGVGGLGLRIAVIVIAWREPENVFLARMAS